MNWWRDRSLTLVLLALFGLCSWGQVTTGRSEYNESQAAHGQPALNLRDYLATGHPWEALFENWESEFLQMAAFVLLSTRLVQKGSPESRRRGVVEPFDADPRDHSDAPGAPWPVRRGGLALALYEHSLSLALLLLFAGSWAGHVLGGRAEFNADRLAHGQAALSLTAYLGSPRLWFESLQNWQSEFLSIAAMVWLSVYLRERGSKESKAVHAAHDDYD
jgi:hypothetical protein